MHGRNETSLLIYHAHKMHKSSSALPEWLELLWLGTMRLHWHVAAATTDEKLRRNAYKHTRTFAHASSHRDTSNKHPTPATNGGTWFDAAVVVAVAWRAVSTAHPEQLYEWTEKVFVVCFAFRRALHIFTVFSFVHCRICTPKKRRRNSKFHWSSLSAGGLFSLWQNVTAWARREQCIKLRHFSFLFSFLFITKIWLQSFSPSSLASCLKTLNYSLFLHKQRRSAAWLLEWHWIINNSHLVFSRI